MNVNMLDLAVVFIAGLENLLIAAMFFSRLARKPGLDNAIGIPIMLLAIPLVGMVGFNAATGRAWWYVLLPVPFILFCILDLVLDYILKLPFRQTRLLGPYLGLFYLGQLGLMGYAFATGKVYGMLILVTYFISLAASGISYARVGHGV
jgi:hypothetical protein